MKNILVVGANGMLGYAATEYFSREGYNVKALTRKEFDIAKDSMENFGAFLERVEVVINCAGIIKPMVAQNSIEDILRVNSIFPRNLAKICSKKNILCFHITTDCVYSGKKGNYTEDDYFDAEDVYGVTKNAGEISDCMVLRTSIIGEEKGQSRSLLEWARGQKDKEVNAFINHYWNGITTIQFAKIVKKIMNNNLYQKGIFHVHSPNTVTKFELLSMINKVYKLKLKIKPIEHEIYCDRTLKSIKSLCNKLATNSIEQQIKEMYDFFNN